MTTRVAQNFRGCHALVIAEMTPAVGVLPTALQNLGLSVEFCPLSNGVATLDLGSLNAESDIIFLNGDLNGALQPPTTGSALPVPVIGLVGIEAPGRLRGLVNHGVTAFIRKPVHVSSVYTALFLGVNQFMQRDEMLRQLNEHNRRRQRRRLVVKATLFMMKAMRIDDDAAYAILRRESMRRRRSIEDYCEEFLSHPEMEQDISRHNVG